MGQHEKLGELAEKYPLYVMSQGGSRTMLMPLAAFYKHGPPDLAASALLLFAHHLGWPSISFLIIEGGPAVSMHVLEVHTTAGNPNDLAVMCCPVCPCCAVIIPTISRSYNARLVDVRDLDEALLTKLSDLQFRAAVHKECGDP